MGFSSLWPLFLGISIPLLVLLYILKRRYREKVISSSVLWSEVYKNTHASTPFEKFRKNIMFLFQLIVLIAIILALMNPFLKFGGKEYKNVILVVDNTASMTTKYEDTTRLEKGKNIASEYINSIKEGTNTYIITYDGSTNIALSDSQDRNLTLKTIADIKNSYGAGDIKEALSFVRAIGDGFGEEYETLFITDEVVELGDIKGSVVSLANSGENASIDNIAHKFLGENLKVISTISNTGSTAYSGDFSLYNGTELIDVKTIELQPSEKTTLSYELKAFKGTNLKGELSKKDLIEEDNIFYDVVKEVKAKRILLVTEQNVFLEKAFSSLENVDLFKTNDFSNIAKDDKYDLYIFDGKTPEVLPKEGNILFINPISNEFFKVSAGGELKEAKIIKGTLSSYLDNMQFTLAKYNTIEVPYWGKTFLEVEGNAVGFIGDKDNRQIGALAFDIHDTDVALRQEFPIMIYELGNKLISSGLVNKNNYKGGEEILVNSSNLSTKSQVSYPGEKPVDLPQGGIVNSKELLGIYKVTETLESGKNTEEFAVNFPSEKESKVSDESLSEVSTETVTKGIKKGFNLAPILILLALGVVSIEWIYYLKGN